MSKLDVFSLEGRTAFVTGGNSGIGRSIVELFAANGAKVGFSHLGAQEQAAGFASDLRAKGFDVTTTECDVTDEDSISRMATWSAGKLGHVDILVNSAGIGGDKPFVELTTADWDRMISVHLRGSFLVTRVFFQAMVERKYGRIINIASQLAYKGAPGLAHYCAAKAGMVGFTRALSLEGASHGVLVNAIAPGPTETELLAGLSDDWRAMKRAQLPLGRFGRVEEISATALLLAAEVAGGYFVGQTLSPNGGDVML